MSGDMQTGASGADAPAYAYDDNAIQQLPWNEHIRRRPGMYIGSSATARIPTTAYMCLSKGVIDNSIDEFNMGVGKRIDITITDEGEVTVRDYGRGIPLGKVKEVASKSIPEGKFDDKYFKKSVGLNGVGLKAVNALSTECEVRSVREGKMVRVDFERGNLLHKGEPEPTREQNGTMVRFRPDNSLFRNYSYNLDFVETMVNNYTYLNAGLQIYFNGNAITAATASSTCCART